MSDALEQELRAILAEKAATLPEEISGRIFVVDFHPRVHRRRISRPWPLPVAGVAVLLTTVVAVILLVTAGTRPPRVPRLEVQPSIPAAFAGWTPVPSRATARRIAQYAQRCRWAASHKSQLKSPLIADVRGPYTAILFVDQRDNYERYCIYGPNIGGQGSNEIRLPLFEAAPGRDGIQHNGMTGSCGDGRAVGEMHGEVGADVRGATFSFPNRASVQASVRRGFYLVWWPWGLWPTEITLTTTEGTMRVQMPGMRHRDRRWC